MHPAPTHLHARRVFLLFVCLFALCGTARAQTEKTITIRMIDSRTGMLIASSNYLVRINHEETEHGDWVKKNEDGSGSLALPSGADVLLIRATYDWATVVYANCDADKDRGSSEHAPAQDHWYPVDKIVSSGLVAPNGCVGKKVPEKLQVVAKPGEFVFFVRPRSARERFTE
jgi:hypothetical protein